MGTHGEGSDHQGLSGLRKFMNMFPEPLGPSRNGEASASDSCRPIVTPTNIFIDVVLFLVLFYS